MGFLIGLELRKIGHRRPARGRVSIELKVRSRPLRVLTGFVGGVAFGLAMR